MALKFDAELSRRSKHRGHETTRETQAWLAQRTFRHRVTADPLIGLLRRNAEETIPLLAWHAASPCRIESGLENTAASYLLLGTSALPSEVASIHLQ